MRHMTSVAFATILAAVSNAETGHQLFNGKDLSNWEHFLVKSEAAMSDVWRVEDGLLICAGEPQGYLCTKDSFTNFKVVVEWRRARSRATAAFCCGFPRRIGCSRNATRLS